MLSLLLATSARAAPALELGIMGEFVTHPGAFVGVDLAPREEPGFGWGLGARAGGYVHPGRHWAVFALGEVGPEIAWERWALGLRLGLGVHHQWLAAPLFVAEGNGVGRTIDAGRPTALGAIGLRATSTAGPIRPFARADLWSRGPVQRGLRTEIVVSAGITLNGSRP